MWAARVSSCISWVKKRTDDVSNHEFKIGQAVFYTPGVGSSRRSDVFTVMQRDAPSCRSALLVPRCAEVQPLQFVTL
jgi:hypothetical protein